MSKERSYYSKEFKLKAIELGSVALTSIRIKNTISNLLLSR
jgi:hypothetical protein